MKFFKKKAVLRTLIAAALLCMVSVSTFFFDANRAEQGKRPIFILYRQSLDDGGTSAYYGLGYQIVMWKRMVSTEEAGFQGYYMGTEAHYLFGMAVLHEPPRIELTLVEQEDTDNMP